MYKKNIIQFCLLIIALIVSIQSYASYVPGNPSRYPFYLGITNGYGTTTWANLVPKDASTTMSLSTPIRVSEGGYDWGFYGGYEIIPEFAIEGSYMHYPNANLFFDEMSLFSFYHDDMTHLNTKTNTVSLVGKFMLTIPHTNGLRAYSSAGAAEVHRNDNVVDRWRLSPQFGVGLNYNITDRVMAELGTEYVAGYGQSELDPAEHYIPFLYSVFFRIAYRFQM